MTTRATTDDASGEYVLRNRATGGAERVVEKSALAAEIAVLHRALPDQPVVIAADKNVKYDEVVSLLGALHAQGVKRVGLVAKEGA